MFVKIEPKSYYIVTFRSKAFRAILGCHMSKLIRLQREHIGIELPSDIISVHKLPKGYIA